MKYSTVRFISLNRAYLGHSKYSGEWYPGTHPPLVNEQQFNAAQRGYTPGHRHGRHLLSGTVRCGLCGRVASIRYNDRGQGFFRCGGQGKRCTQPPRSANGLERATVIGLRVIAADLELQAAIRYQLTAHRRAELERAPSNRKLIALIQKKLRKLLDLHYDDFIDAATFAAENRHLTAQMNTLEQEDEQRKTDAATREEAVSKFDLLAKLLTDFDAQRIWETATEREQWVLVKDLVDSVCMYPDRLTVQVAGAPPVTVTLAEAGLKEGGITGSSGSSGVVHLSRHLTTIESKTLRLGLPA
jgi:hypothetical protein